MNLVAVLEGLLFVVGEDGLSMDQAMSILDIDQKELVDILQKLQDSYIKEDRGIRLSALGNHLKLTTKKEHKEYYTKLLESEDDSLLSQSCLEVLAIVAYNEPITRSLIDDIRGLNSSHIVRKLSSKNLIKELGRAETAGRPILYGVTNEFLDYFGLSSVGELPKIEPPEVIEDKKDLFESKYQENE